MAISSTRRLSARNSSSTGCRPKSGAGSADVMSDTSGGEPPVRAVGRVLDHDTETGDLIPQAVGLGEIAAPARLAPLLDQRLDPGLQCRIDRRALALRCFEQPEDARQRHQLRDARE